MPLSRFWLQTHDLERLAQLRQDAQNVFDVLITLAYASKDEVYARALKTQGEAIVAYVDRALEAAAQGEHRSLNPARSIRDLTCSEVNFSADVVRGCSNHGTNHTGCKVREPSARATYP